MWIGNKEIMESKYSILGLSGGGEKIRKYQGRGDEMGKVKGMEGKQDKMKVIMKNFV